MESDEYRRATNPDARRQLLAAVEPGVHRKRISTKEGYHSVARKLSHTETGGMFVFETEARGSKRFNVSRDCILCGVPGHRVLECGEYSKAGTLKRRRPRGPQDRQVSAHEQLVSFGPNGIYHHPATPSSHTMSYNLVPYSTASPQEPRRGKGGHEDVVHGGRDGDTQMGRGHIVHSGRDEDTQMELDWDANIDPSLRSLDMKADIICVYVGSVVSFGHKDGVHGGRDRYADGIEVGCQH
jgi:hypothetical protein